MLNPALRVVAALLLAGLAACDRSASTTPSTSASADRPAPAMDASSRPAADVGHDVGHDAGKAASPGPIPAPGAPAPPRRLFISGHSLLDQPLPDQLAAVAASLGTPIDWNRQYLLGSSIRDRTAGEPGGGDWNGYRRGGNRVGENLDLLAELDRAGRSAEPYDTLLITEQHSLLGTLVWNDTVRHLRHFHERFIAANPAGRTWFYEPWLDIDRKDDPTRWIAYEREASKVWQCVVTRINVSLQAEGRADRIASVPAGRALVHLVEQATMGAGVPGIGEGSRAATPQATRAAIDLLLRDNVHLTPLGSYYLALVVDATLFQRSPRGAWVPDGVSAEQAASLQRIADEFVSADRTQSAALTLPECRELLERSFINDYWSYVRDTTWRGQQGQGWVSSQANWLKHVAQWHWRFARDHEGNPFHFDPATDRTYWLPAPR